MFLIKGWETPLQLPTEPSLHLVYLPLLYTGGQAGYHVSLFDCRIYADVLIVLPRK